MYAKQNSYVIGQWRRRWSTDSPHLLHIKHHSSTTICLFQRLSVVKILPKVVVQEKNATLGGTFNCPTIFSFIARLLWSYGIWFLVYLDLVGSCLFLLLGSLLAGKVTLVATAMELFGRSFLFVWCGVFGRRGIVDALKTLSVLCPTSSFFLSEPYLTGSLCGETILFLFWIYLTFVIFVLDCSPLYTPCVLGCLFLINEFLLLIKKIK